MTKTSDSSTSENKNAKDFPAFFGCYRMPAPHDERAASHAHDRRGPIACHKPSALAGPAALEH